MPEEPRDEIWGQWWLPGTEERLVGRLQFDRSEGARLTLAGDFAELPPRVWSRLALFGETADGTPLTLLSPFWLQRPPPIAGLSLANAKTLVGSHVFLRGAHAETFSISKASVRLRGLRELCFRPAVPRIGVTKGFVGDGDGELLERHVDVAGGRVSFVHQTYETRSEYGQTIERDVEVVITPQTALALDDFEEQWLAPLQGLVIFAGRDPTFLESMVVVQATTTPVHPAIPRGSGTVNWDEERLEVLMPLPGLTAEPRHGYERALVPFAVLGDDATAFIARWWELHRKLGPVTEVLITAIGSQLFLDNRLLNEMSFAESYHRILHDEPPITDAQHDAYVEAMLATVQDRDDRQHYKVRLRYAAAQGQRQRLKWLIRRAKEVLPMLAGLNSDLADQLVDTRNALTHLDPAGPSALGDEGLYRAIELLEVAIQSNLLLDLKFPPRDVCSLIRTSYLNQTPFISVEPSQ